MAHPTPEPKDAHAGEVHVEHIWSWAPIVIALAVPFLYLALLWPKYMLPIGVLIGAVGLGRWIQEDMSRFRRGSYMLPLHGGQPGPLVGTILFIGTEVLIFGGIFAVWFVGKYHAAKNGEVWGGEIELPVFATAINTAVLVASGGTLHWGYLRLRKNDYRGFRIGLVLTLVLGAAFLIQQIREYLNLINHEGLTIKGSTQHGIFGSAFYMLTGTHGLHVAGGLFVLAIVLFRALKNTQSKEHHILLESAAFYWHFVDVVWLFLFVVVYLKWL